MDEVDNDNKRYQMKLFWVYSVSHVFMPNLMSNTGHIPQVKSTNPTLLITNYLQKTILTEWLNIIYVLLDWAFVLIIHL